MAAFAARLADSAAQLRAELDSVGDLKQKAEAEKGKLGGAGERFGTNAWPWSERKPNRRQQPAALERMTADLALLENTLRDLKAARERERQTYSVGSVQGPPRRESPAVVHRVRGKQHRVSPRQGDDPARACGRFRQKCFGVARQGRSFRRAATSRMRLRT